MPSNPTQQSHRAHLCVIISSNSYQQTIITPSADFLPGGNQKHIFAQGMDTIPNMASGLDIHSI